MNGQGTWAPSIYILGTESIPALASEVQMYEIYYLKNKNNVLAPYNYES